MTRLLAVYIVKYFEKLRIAFHEAAGLTGFLIFLIMYVQIVSGVMLSFSYTTESMNIPLSREEESAETIYTDDFFYLHERGVDLLELFVFIHVLRKIYLSVADIEQEVAWKSGAILFLLLQVVVFTGLVLCCTHLSDITLVIASNILHTFCLFTGKVYWLLFTDQSLNTDTITRLGYIHFALGIFIGGLSIYHGIDMHYDWKSGADIIGIEQELNWYDEGLVSEIAQTLEFLLILGILCLFLFSEPEALSYELFMWGDIGMITDVRFPGVAPHWYFRPYMAWLLTCPYHYAGIAGLILFFLAFYYQPNLVGRGELELYNTIKTVVLNFLTTPRLFYKRLATIYRATPDLEATYFFSYGIFLICVWYSFSYLPYGRFFNRLGGNDSGLFCYAYLFIYMGGGQFRLPGLIAARKTLSF